MLTLVLLGAESPLGLSTLLGAIANPCRCSAYTRNHYRRSVDRCASPAPASCSPLRFPCSTDIRVSQRHHHYWLVLLNHLFHHVLGSSATLGDKYKCCIRVLGHLSIADGSSCTTELVPVGWETLDIDPVLPCPTLTEGIGATAGARYYLGDTERTVHLGYPIVYEFLVDDFSATCHNQLHFNHFKNVFHFTPLSHLRVLPTSLM